MTMLQRLRGRRAQALVESALIFPFLALLMLGAADLGRAFYLSIEISGATRAGMRNGIVGTGNDVGDSVRAEPNTAIQNTAAAWGSTGPGGTADCNPGSAGHSCGDLAGCAPASFATNQVACFAVRTCSVAGSGSCSATGAWGSRPAGGGVAPTGLQVRVIYKFTPATPLIASFGGVGGSLYLTRDTYGLALY